MVMEQATVLFFKKSLEFLVSLCNSILPINKKDKEKSRCTEKNFRRKEMEIVTGLTSLTRMLLSLRQIAKLFVFEFSHFGVF